MQVNRRAMQMVGCLAVGAAGVSVSVPTVVAQLTSSLLLLLAICLIGGMANWYFIAYKMHVSEL